MTTEFTQLNLHPQLIQAVTELGYTAPMPVQEAIIPLMIEGRDVIGQAQTGTGKTAAFALPILQTIQPQQQVVQALIVVPTRELALQVVEAISDYGRYRPVRVLAVYGGQPYQPQINRLRKGVDIVAGTPGRLLDLIQKHILNLAEVRTVVLDEADEMLSMGFIEDINTILSETPSTRQTALFSATLPPQIRRLADKYMCNPQAITLGGGQATVAMLDQRYCVVNQNDKLAALTRMFEVEEITSALVFARTRAGTSELANELMTRGYSAEVLNGDLSQDAREQTLQRFRENKLQVLVATDVAARGLDIEDISHVFNYDLPDDPEIYVHRVGRTGRAGKSGIAITLITPRERRNLKQIETFTRHKINPMVLPSEEDILNHRKDKLVKQMGIWLQRGRYRKEREIVEALLLEGHDAVEIAAAALKVARADEKQRPIAPVGEVVEPAARHPERRAKPARSGSSRPAVQGSVSHEAGMVRLMINMGKHQGVRPGDIVGAIASHAHIPGYTIGKISIQDKHSLVDVPEEFLPQVLAKNKEVFILKQSIQLVRA
ncbi:MAG: DEAD/DEAH box helicase [Anaerolineaceae bacterium]|nr:DEAD/DEAH box helicase [Anaerolineaceae bacterium]